MSKEKTPPAPGPRSAAAVQEPQVATGKLPVGVTGRGFVKGRSGNPSGRKAGVPSITAALRRGLTQADADMIAAKLVALAASGEIAAVRVLLDRCDGPLGLDISLTGGPSPKGNEEPGAYYERLIGLVEVWVKRSFPGWEPPSPVTTVEVTYVDAPPLVHRESASPAAPPADVSGTDTGQRRAWWQARASRAGRGAAGRGGARRRSRPDHGAAGAGHPGSASGCSADGAPPRHFGPSPEPILRGLNTFRR